MHSRPFHYWAWLDRAGEFGRPLLAANAGWDVRWAMNHALATRAIATRLPGEKPNPRRGGDLPHEKLVLFGQEEIRQIYDAPNSAILEGLHFGRWPDEKVERHARLIHDRLEGFAPDVIVTWTASAALRRAFPDALVLHTEEGPFSRGDFPSQVVLDPQGCFGHSVLGTHADEIRSLPGSARDVAVYRALRDRLAAHHRSVTPFAGTERRLRRKYRTLALLPLQFGGEMGFDTSGPFRNQGEYLFHVLERIPADVGLLVTHHGTSLWLGDRIDEETQEYLATACPQALFVPPQVSPNAGQMLVPHVDAVISVSSSVGLQAIFWGKRLIAPGWSHLARWADGTRVEDLAEGALPPARDLDGAFTWLFRHYWTRLALVDGAWLDSYLRGAMARWSAGRRGLDFFPGAEPIEAYEAALLAQLPAVAPRPEVTADLLTNGALAGPPGRAPDAWKLLPGPRAEQSLSQVAGADGAGALRIDRHVPGAGPTILFQPVDGIERLAGAFVTVRFRARGSVGEGLSVYFYQQFGSGGSDPSGTEPTAFGLEPEWREFACTVTIPEAGGRVLGEGHHTELAFLLPPGLDGAWVELAGVALEPGSLF